MCGRGLPLTNLEQKNAFALVRSGTKRISKDAKNIGILWLMSSFGHCFAFAFAFVFG
jgi:hypothetical protein